MKNKIQCSTSERKAKHMSKNKNRRTINELTELFGDTSSAASGNMSDQVLDIPDFDDEFDTNSIFTKEVPEDIKPYIIIKDCSDFKINRYFLTDDLKEIFDSICRMRAVSKEMHKLGVAYLNSTFLFGVPGTGKTTFAQWVAYTLDLPYVFINYAKIFNGVFGDTSRRISEIFDFVKHHECIFCMDEIDCVSTKRGTESAATGGELARITITIMQELDNYRNSNAECIVLAASNTWETMDPALISRFSVTHEVKPLNNEDKGKYIRQFLTDVGMDFSDDNIDDYVMSNLHLNQREVEADMIRCIARFIEDTKINHKIVPYVLDHIEQ